MTLQHRVHPPSLAQGFTTVRDAGGADYGLREAVASGLYPGPRLLVSGRVLSQTGVTATSAVGRSGSRPSRATSACSP